MKQFLLFLFLFPLLAAAQPADTVRNPFLEDYDYFILKLQQTHPDPYTAFGGRVQFYLRMQEIREKMREVRDADGFNNLVQPLLATLGDGHTWLGRFDHEREQKWLQLLLLISSDGFYIRGVTHDGDLPLMGTLVRKVDGIPVEQLLDKATTLHTAENEVGRYVSLEEALNGNLDAELLLGHPVDSLELEVFNGERTFTHKVGYSDNTSLAHTAPRIFHPNQENRILFSKIHDGVGYFYWGTTLGRELIEAYRNNPALVSSYTNWAFSVLQRQPSGDLDKDLEQIPSLYGTMADLLTEMKRQGISDLVIDLRQNTGGMTPMVYALLHMIYGDRFLAADFSNLSYSTRLSPLLMEKWQLSGLEAYNEKNGTDYRYGDFLVRTMVPYKSGPDQVEQLRSHPAMLGFNGFGEADVRRGLAVRPEEINVYVLTSSSTFSAAYHFMYYLSRMGATVVGVAPRQAGNAFMEATNFRLPNAGTRGSISNSLQLIFPDDAEKGRLFRPDVEMTFDAYRSYGFNADAEFLQVLDLIRERAARP